jgi:hypothetical protein
LQLKRKKGFKVMSRLANLLIHIITASVVLFQSVVFPKNSALAMSSVSAASLVKQLSHGSLRLTDPNIRQLVMSLRGQLTRDQRQSLTLAYYQENILRFSDLEVFARTAEFSAEINSDRPDEFMRDLNRLILEASSNPAAIFAGPWGRLRERIHLSLAWVPGYSSLYRFGCSGFAALDGSNQVQHFWYSAAIAFTWGGALADLLAQYHEWNAPGLLKYLPGSGMGQGTWLDLHLSRQGIEFGRALAEGRLRPEDAGRWGVTKKCR